MYEMSEKHKFPFSVNVQWNKTRPDRVFKVAKEFKNIAAVGASMQTLNPKVLESIKKKKFNSRPSFRITKTTKSYWYRR